jgi:hypothetical protein
MMEQNACRRAGPAIIPGGILHIYSLVRNKKELSVIFGTWPVSVGSKKKHGAVHKNKTNILRGKKKN